MLTQLIEEENRQLAEMQAADPRIVLDGAVDIVRYVAASPRILWVLKEPHGGGPWDLRHYFRDQLFSNDKGQWHRTAGLLIVVSHGLLNGNLPWGAWATDARSIADSLRDVAVININKFGGDAVADWDRLYRAGLELGPVIERQINALSPQIVILGGSFGVLPNTVRQRLAVFDESEQQAVKVGDTIYIRAYHTNQRTITHETYYQRIRDQVIALQSLGTT